MTTSENPKGAEGLTRRGFLGRVTLGLAAIAGIAIPLRGLLPRSGEASGPGEGLPEDSIFQPRKGSGSGDGTRANV